MSDLEAVKAEETAAEETVSSPEVSPAEPPVDTEATKVPAEVPAKPVAESAESGDDVTIDNLKIGQHLQGTVKNITDFGAFVDVGIPQDGLVHISKLAKWKVEKVEDVVSIGQQVDVWVKKVDKKRGRLSLTMIKPISLRLRDIEEGAELSGTVTRLEPYGAFIDIGSEREGLVHISQVSHDYIKHPEEALAVDDKVQVQVLKVDRKKRQVDLSIKALLAPPEPEVVEKVETKKEVAVPDDEGVEEEPRLTAMAVAYTALQGKENDTEEDEKQAKKKDRQNEMDDIISRTLATRE
jgi:transcriptional accessory protein Tex/SPT6